MDKLANNAKNVIDKFRSWGHKNKLTLNKAKSLSLKFHCWSNIADYNYTERVYKYKFKW